MATTKEMQIEFITKETVTPSSPTPSHLRTFNLCLLDQIFPPIYVPLLLFYPTSTAGGSGGGSSSSDRNGDCRKKKQTTETSQWLKKSLSETLTCFYPLAGRMKAHGSLVVNCNDEGAHYSEAKVINRSLTDLLHQPKSEELKHFIPTEDSFPSPLLLVQATFFDCGGMVIGMSVFHKIADAATLLSFAKAWAANATLGYPNAVVPSFKAASLFPSRDPFPVNCSTYRPTVINRKKNPYIARRYVFHPTKIASLRRKAASPTVQRPSRVEAVSALIWKTAVKASRLRVGGPKRPSVLIWPMNIRPRLEPPLREHSFGNLIVQLAAQNDVSEGDDLPGFVCHLRKQSLDFMDKYGKKLTEDGNENNLVIMDLIEEVAKKRSADPNSYVQSSYCKFQFYEIDFGWGKPTWVRVNDVSSFPNFATMADTSDGEGVEVWVSFGGKEEMALFEGDSELIAFASINPSALQQ